MSLSPDELAGWTLQDVADMPEEGLVERWDEIEEVWPAAFSALDRILTLYDAGKITDENPVLGLTIGEIVPLYIRGAF